ncbi:MAG: hypothetical protein V4506_12530 [Bacteroidota bacterium]
MDITRIITKAITDNQKQEHRAYIGASSIGNPCARAIWYNFVGVTGTPFPVNVKTAFDIGTKLESLVLDYMELAGLKLIRPSESNDYLKLVDEEAPLFQGHMDALMELEHEGSVVVEIKTAKSSSFQRFKTHGLKIWSDTYYAQLQSYMGMGGFKKAVIIALNKDSSEIHHEWLEYDDIFFHALRIKALSIYSCDEPPERINKNPLYMLCARCRYVDVCHGEKRG